jgi:EAL domain-containing protein (putative c-di-GMP-specific phosphodiesterase class I)
LGGDEFVVVLNGINGAQDAAKVANKIIDVLSKPIVIDGHEVFVTTSIGISLFPSDGMDKNALITNADVAMYRAKEEGRNHFQFYTFGMNATTVEQLTLENDLRRAIERDELLLHYQPQISLPDRGVVGVEALVRWQHPELGLVPPARFIPIAEETGLIAPIGQWVLKTACAQARAWQDAGAPPIEMSVNMSSRQFHQENMLETVTNALQQSGLDAKQLTLEITESSLMQKPDDAVVTLCLLHNMGVGIAIDDFGTGYSSLGHLKRFPLQALKIDRAFINDVTKKPEDAAIVRAILAMAHSLSLKVVAEGVETEEQLEFLNQAGCDEIQGFLISKPVTAEEISETFINPKRASA